MTIAEIILAIATTATALFTIFSNQQAARLAARKDELTRLQERVERLENEADKYRRNENKLLDYVAKLRMLIIEKKIIVPDMPSLE